MLVVTVCTANLCRSPLAEHALRRGLLESGVEVDVQSAGLHAQAGSHVPSDWLGVTSALGVDLAAHRPRHVREFIDSADLFLVMTAEHARDLALADASTLGRIALLSRAAGRLQEATTEGPDDQASVAARVVGGRQRATDVLHMSREHDIADPVRLARRDQEAIASNIVQHCERIARAWSA